MTTLLVQLSDLHIKKPGSVAYGHVDTAAFLRQAVESVGRLPQRPDAVVVTGDLTDFGRDDEYAHLRDLLAPLKSPVYLLPGNHDDRAGLRRAFPDHGYLDIDSGGDGGAGFIQYVVTIGGLRLVAVDTVVAGQAHGEVCDARLAWLDACLAQDADTPTVVALHHPPFATGIGHMDRIGLRRSDDLAAVIARHRQVVRVIAGHLHRSIQAGWAGTLAMTAPSTAHQVCLDLADDATPGYAMEPPGFLVHHLPDAGPLVSHLMPVGEFPGPFPFHDGGALID
jgi:3',5'-cyclic AMP phosphodiesterase CpdA